MGGIGTGTAGSGGAGNGSFTGQVYTVDKVSPIVTITNPLGNTTQTSTSVNVTWTESDTGTGIDAGTRSVQRQKATPVAGACTAVAFLNDEIATTSASPRNDTSLPTNTCYRWQVSLADNAANSTTATSGTVLVDNTAPTVTFTNPTIDTTQTTPR